MLVEWLVEQAEQVAEECASPQIAEQEVKRICRWARGVVRFVHLWCYEEAFGAATQLAGSEHFHWPLPATRVDPCELMEQILEWQTRNPSRRLAQIP